MACRFRSPDGAVGKTVFSRCRTEERNDIRKVGTAAVVKDACVKIWSGPAVVQDLDREDRREEKRKNEQELHSWYNLLT